MFSESKSKFKTKESQLSRSVLGMSEKEAIKLIEKNGLIAFVEKRDKTEFYPSYPTAHSYRIKLTVRNGKVVGTDIG